MAKLERVQLPIDYSSFPAFGTGTEQGAKGSRNSRIVNDDFSYFGMIRPLLQKKPECSRQKYWQAEVTEVKQSHAVVTSLQGLTLGRRYKGYSRQQNRHDAGSDANIVQK